MPNDPKQAAQAGYAAWLVDPNHRVEIGLYPFPQNAEELATVLSHVRALPHTAEEQEQILGQLARISREFLSAEELEARFPGIQPAAAENPEPVRIELTAENYGLLYSAVQYAPGSRGPVTPLGPAAAETQEETEPPNEETPAESEAADAPNAEAEAATSETEPDPSAGEPPAAPETGEAENPLLARIEALTQQLAGLKEEALKPQEAAPAPEVAELEQRLTAAEDSEKRALAASVALYMSTLRKPQARDKSQESLVSELMEKSLDVLRDRLEVLMGEAASGPLPTLGQLPQVDDPTQGTGSEGEESERTPSSTDPEQLKTEITEEEIDEEEATITVREDGDALALLFAELENEPR